LYFHDDADTDLQFYSLAYVDSHMLDDSHVHSDKYTYIYLHAYHYTNVDIYKHADIYLHCNPLIYIYRNQDFHADHD
jgi:hypothetical protein